MSGRTPERTSGAPSDPGYASPEASTRTSVRDGLDAPRVLGKYRIVAQLGEGGAATVYLALASGPAGVNKLLVVKVLKRQLASEPEFLRMFLDEARLSTRLNHPNIVQMIEVGSADDRHFTVMEYLEGKPLSHVMGARIPGIGLNVLVHLIAEALGGFHYAHELVDYDGTPLEVIHRDVSPQNLFITYDGHAKVLDFGVAKMTFSHETEVGVIKGKPRYMAPEQVLGSTIDRRADVFSAGVILWEAIVGRRMWANKSDVAVLYAVSNGHVPSLAEAAPNAPPELARIVTKALAQDQDERYPTALALQEDLEAYLRSTGELVSPREIGRLLTQHFASDRAHIKAAIEAQLGAMASVNSSSEFRVVSFQDRTPDPERSSLSPQGARASLARTPVAAGTKTKVPSITPPPSPVPPAPRSSRGGSGRATWVVVITLAAASASALTWWSQKGFPKIAGETTAAPPAAATFATPGPELAAPAAPPAASPASSSSAAMATPSASAPAGAAQVTVTLVAAPSNARLFFDGKPLPSNPYVAHLARDPAPHVLRAEAPGYPSREVSVSLGSDGVFDATLARNPPPRGHGRAEPVAPSPAPQATPAAPAAAGATPAAPADTAAPHTPPKKRALDRDTPYSE